MIRVGHGYDVHKFGGNGPIYLGGIAVPHEQGLLAHSDGDVALHALCDALLGSLALGDIGKHFPDTDAKYSGIDSKALLKSVYDKVNEEGFQLANADITIAAQAPKLAPHIDHMRACIANVLDVAVSCISVKATTTEGLGFVGERKGIACYASVLVQAK